MKKKLERLFLVAVALVTVTHVSSAQKIEPNADSVIVAGILKDRTAAFILFDNDKEETFWYNKPRCAERFSPKSTFKIPNSLIALETGVAPDENFVIKWDGKKRWNEDWNRDHTLATAIQFSVVPYYQELARRIGPLKYEKYLNVINYGNNKIGIQVDTFWLDNSLKISAEEQVAFLKRFYDYRLPFSKRNVDVVKKIIPTEKYKHSVLKFKTGTGEKKDGTYIGWLVGYVEKEKNVYFYAFNIESKTFDEVRELRDTLPRKILESLKVLE